MKKALIIGALVLSVVALTAAVPSSSFAWFGSGVGYYGGYGGCGGYGGYGGYAGGYYGYPANYGYLAMAIRATGAVPMAEVGEEAGAAGATEVATGSSEGSGRDGMPRT